MPIKSFGIIVSTLDTSLSSQALINNINELLTKHYEYCPIIFYQSLVATTIPIKCCMLQQQQVWGFEHPLISTNIVTTRILNKCTRSNKKFFYVDNLEWTSIPNIFYKDLKDIYQNPNIELIAKVLGHSS